MLCNRQQAIESKHISITNAYMFHKTFNGNPFNICWDDGMVLISCITQQSPQSSCTQFFNRRPAGKG